MPITKEKESMEIEEKLVEENGETLAPESVAANPEKVEKMFTQGDVDKIVGKTRIEARERALNELRQKYGVDNDNELDDIFGRGQSYDMLNEDYENLLRELESVKSENALLKSKVRPDRWEDVKLILKGKNLEISEENITKESATHPEWKSGNPEDTTKKEKVEKVRDEGVGEDNPEKESNISRISTLGNEMQGTNGDSKSDDVEDKLRKLFNL
jgi:hypothetical protein